MSFTKRTKYVGRKHTTALYPFHGLFYILTDNSIYTLLAKKPKQKSPTSGGSFGGCFVAERVADSPRSGVFERYLCEWAGLHYKSVLSHRVSVFAGTLLCRLELC